MNRKDSSKSKKRKAYQKPTLKKHNDVLKSVKLFKAGPPSSAQASPIAPAAVVF